MVTTRPSGIDRGDRLLQKAHPGLGEVAIREANGLHRRPAEHHVELRVPEDERIVLVDQGHVDVFAERLRQGRCELEPPEAGSENHDTALHSVDRLRLVFGADGAYMP